MVSLAIFCLVARSGNLEDGDMTGLREGGVSGFQESRIRMSSIDTRPRKSAEGSFIGIGKEEVKLQKVVSSESGHGS